MDPVMLSEDNIALGAGISASSRHPPVKRARIQLSCTPCRTGKLKCDRQLPCQQCTKRDKSSNCTYPVPVERRKPLVSLQKRLQHLENLVKDVMTIQTLSSTANDNDTNHFKKSPESSQDSQARSTDSIEDRGPSRSPSDGIPAASGSVVKNSKETAYIGATHWAAILDNIEEVKSYFGDGDDESPSSDDVPGTDFFFQAQTHSTAQDLIASLPPRHVVDKQILQFFQSPFPTKHLFHRPTFQKQYNRFWENTDAPSIGFLALLYALMSHATFASMGKGGENPDKRGTHLQMINAYRKWCAECLVLSNYTQPGPYTITAMLIYMEGEFVIGNQVKCYLLSAVVLRLGLRVGLHRDATKVAGNISVFNGEMQRRLWRFLIQIDLLASFHLGLPGMVQAIESDTEYPRNLRDEDFDEDSTFLPAGRPDSEITPMSYLLGKGNLMGIFGQIVAQANRLSLPAYDEILRLDDALNDVFAKVPSFYRVVPLELAFADSAELIIQRFSMAVLYCKSRCVLHRKYMLNGPDGRDFSKQASLDASMQLLRYQSIIHDAVQSDGLLSREQWFVSSLSIHDFLLGATIIYLSIVQAINEVVDGNISHFMDTHREMISSLERSHFIWSETGANVSESKNAADILMMMITRVNRLIQIKEVSGGVSNVGTMLGNPISRLAIDPEALASSSNGNLNGSESSTQTSHNARSSDFTTQFDFSMSYPEDPIGNMLDMPMYFNWDTFDDHLRPQQPVTENPWNDFVMPSFNSSCENDDYTF